MKFGLRYANTGRFAHAAAATEIAQAGEAAGFDSIWTVEHTVVPADYESTYPYAASGKMAGGANDFDLPDPLIWMTHAAAVTTTIKVATGILIVPQHNPVVLAKAVATLADLSGDRVILGIGVGWLEEEFAAIGIPFEDRGPRTDDYVAAMRALWEADGAASYHGEFANFDEIYCRPRPPAGTVPIVVGGHTKAAARRAGRLGDGFFPARGNPVELWDEVRRAAEEAGRDPDSIELTVSAPSDPAELEALAAAGVDRVLVPLTEVAGLTSMVGNADDVERYGREVIDVYGD